jgi:imidazolonepropionase-like amidohydrolase
MSGALIAGIALACVAAAAAIGVLVANQFGAFKKDTAASITVVKGTPVVPASSALMYAAVLNPVSKAVVGNKPRIPRQQPTGISFKLG